MQYDIRIEQAEPRRLAAVRREAKLSELSRVIPASLGDVWAYIKKHNVPHHGLNVAVYLDCKFTLELGVLVDADVADDGNVHPAFTPGGTVAATTHFGPYRLLGGAHEAIKKWCLANGREFAGPSWELYGHWDADESKLRTDVYYVIK